MARIPSRSSPTRPASGLSVFSRSRSPSRLFAGSAGGTPSSASGACWVSSRSSTRRSTSVPTWCWTSFLTWPTSSRTSQSGRISPWARRIRPARSAAVTSTTAMIQRLGGRRWRLLHRLIYVSAASAVVHYLWLVKADTLRPVAYGTILAALLGFRAWHAFSARAKRTPSRDASSTQRALPALRTGVEPET